MFVQCPTDHLFLFRPALSSFSPYYTHDGVFFFNRLVTLSHLVCGDKEHVCATAASMSFPSGHPANPSPAEGFAYRGSKPKTSIPGTRYQIFFDSLQAFLCGIQTYSMPTRLAGGMSVHGDTNGASNTGMSVNGDTNGAANADSENMSSSEGGGTGSKIGVLRLAGSSHTHFRTNACLHGC